MQDLPVSHEDPKVIYKQFIWDLQAHCTTSERAPQLTHLQAGKTKKICSPRSSYMKEEAVRDPLKLASVRTANPTETSSSWILSGLELVQFPVWQQLEDFHNIYIHNHITV